MNQGPVANDVRRKTRCPARVVPLPVHRTSSKLASAWNSAPSNRAAEPNITPANTASCLNIASRSRPASYAYVGRGRMTVPRTWLAGK